MEKNNNLKKEPKKVQIKLKLSTLIIVTVIIVIILASNVFAGIMGYGNVFFMIKNLVTTGTLDGKEAIFSDKEITISYAEIEIVKDVKLQVNKLQIRENNSTLIMQFKDKRTDKTNITLELKDSESNSLCSKIAEDGEIQMNIDRTIGETEKLSLVIKNNNTYLKTLTIDLQSREILVEGEEEISKLSEIELRKYLGAFALVNNDMTADELVHVAQLLDFTLRDSERQDAPGGEEFTKSIEEFWGRKQPQLEDGVVKVTGELYKYDKLSNIYYKAKEDDDIYKKGVCLSIEDISYKDGIYTVKYIYGIIRQNDNIEAIKDTEYVVSTIKLKYNSDAEYAKFKVVELVDSKMIDYVVDDDVIKDITSDKNEESNSSNKFDDETVKKAIEKYLEISGRSCASPEAFVESLGFKPEGKPDANYLIKTKIKYSEFKEKVLTYMTEELFQEKYATFVSEQDGMLCYLDTGASGLEYTIKSIKKLSDNKYLAIVDELVLEENNKFKFEFIIENYKGNCVIAGETSENIDQSEGDTKTCDHDYVIQKADYSTGKDEHIKLDGTLNATHTFICDKCGETIEQKHSFDQWNSINNNTAWTLWCIECDRYVYTEDYNEVLSSGYSVKNNDSSYQASYIIKSSEMKAGEKYEVYYFKNDVLESYKGVTVDCKNDGEIEFSVTEPGIYKIGMVSNKNVPNKNIIGSKNYKFEATEDGNAVAVYNIKNSNIKLGKNYRMMYFIDNKLESYKGEDAICTVDGELVFHMYVPGNYSIGMILDTETNQTIVKETNIKFELKADGSVEAK